MQIKEIVLTRREYTTWEKLFGQRYGHTKAHRLPRGKKPYLPEDPRREVDLTGAERIQLENGESIIIKTDSLFHETWLVDKDGMMLAQCGFHVGDPRVWPVMVAYSTGKGRAMTLIRGLCMRKGVVVVAMELSPGAEKMVRRMAADPRGLVMWAYDVKDGRRVPLFQLRADRDFKRLYDMGNKYMPAACIGAPDAIRSFFDTGLNAGTTS